jgi:DNA-binding transcriptional LysR family regulator
MRYVAQDYGKTEGKEGVMRLDLADLRLFIAIVDTGSITGGAAAAHLALASASERLRKMEAEVGVPLLHRHARG